MTNDNEMTAAIAKANEAHKLVTRLIPVGGSELREAMAARETAEAEFEALCAAQPCGQVDPNGACTTCGGSGLYSPGIECGDCDAAERLRDARLVKGAEAIARAFGSKASPEDRCPEGGSCNHPSGVGGCDCIIGEVSCSWNTGGRLDTAQPSEETALRTYLTAMVAAGYGLECILDDNGKLTETKELTVDEALAYLTTDEAPLVWFSREGGCSWRIGGRL